MDLAGLATVWDAGRQASRQAKSLVDRFQEQSTAVAGGEWLIERDMGRFGNEG